MENGLYITKKKKEMRKCENAKKMEKMMKLWPCHN